MVHVHGYEQRDLPPPWSGGGLQVSGLIIFGVAGWPLPDPCPKAGNQMFTASSDAERGPSVTLSQTLVWERSVWQPLFICTLPFYVSRRHTDVPMLSFQQWHSRMISRFLVMRNLRGPPVHFSYHQVFLHVRLLHVDVPLFLVGVIQAWGKSENTDHHCENRQMSQSE